MEKIVERVSASIQRIDTSTQKICSSNARLHSTIQMKEASSEMVCVSLEAINYLKDIIEINKGEEKKNTS